MGYTIVNIHDFQNQSRICEKLTLLHDRTNFLTIEPSGKSQSFLLTNQRAALPQIYPNRKSFQDKSEKFRGFWTFYDFRNL